MTLDAPRDLVENPQQQALSVSELTAQIKDSLEAEFPAVWVSGEISNMSRPQSGHIYLTLKDEAAQLRAVIWRSAASRLRFNLEDGLEVVCQGGIDVYPPRGSYQLVIRRIEPRGMGALELALRQLRARLAAEGLFDAEHKQPLPPFPRRIAFVTSPSGAAIRDFLEVVRQRWPRGEILVIPARVQGEEAAAEIAAGIEQANRLDPAPDVLVVGRGGGSLEDLWCFNEEAVVRAIFASRVPVVSAVGHEIDVTLSDLVADVRALTPSDAARRVVPAADEVEALLHNFKRRLAGSLRAHVDRARARLDALAERRVLRRPLDRIADLSRRLDELDLRSRRALRIAAGQSRERIQALAGRLESLSPLAVLGRGYSLTYRTADDVPLRTTAGLTVGEQVTTVLAHGQLVSRVEQVRTDSDSVDELDD